MRPPSLPFLLGGSRAECSLNSGTINTVAFVCETEVLSPCSPFLYTSPTYLPYPYPIYLPFHLSLSDLQYLRTPAKVLSGGYDACVTRWRLPPPPAPKTVTARECASCPSAETCEKGRAAIAAQAAAKAEADPPREVSLFDLDW